MHTWPVLGRGTLTQTSAGVGQEEAAAAVPAPRETAACLLECNFGPSPDRAVRCFHHDSTYPQKLVCSLRLSKQQNLI
jgi:hypothetical protein